MQRKTLNLVQGTDAWQQHRASHYNASDAPAMMGASKYRTRSELLREKATGLTAEVSEQQQRLYDRGHEAETLIRPMIEQQIGEELYSTTMSAVVEGLPLSASLDGQNLEGDTLLECKLWNEGLAAQVRAGELEPHYIWQLEQQLLVSGAERVIFATGDGRERLETMEYRAVPGRAEQLIAGWHQFSKDVAAYEPEPVRAAPVAAPVEGFGALSLRVEGRIIASNLDAFKADAERFIARLPKPEDLQTDQDFADAKGAVKACEEAEARIKAAKDAAQAEMTDVDAAFRLADTVSQTIRAARLALDKVVKVEEQARKDAIVLNGAKAVRAHYETINETLDEHRIQPPQSLMLDLGAAIKGKKSLASMKDAVDTAVAGFKIAASEQAERVRANVRVFEAEVGSWSALFPDHVALCATKAQEDLRNLMNARITQAKADEQKRADDAEAREEAAHSTTGAEASAAAEPDATEPVRAPAAVVSVGRVGAAPTPAGAKIKLGDINARISPMTITADGLRQLGFEPAGRDRSATLYREVDFPHMCHAMAKVLEQATHKKAA